MTRVRIFWDDESISNKNFMLTFPVNYSTRCKSDSYYIFNFETIPTEIHKVIYAILGVITLMPLWKNSI